MSEPLPEYKILQIIPANGWVARYHGSDNLDEPVVCFALVEQTNSSGKDKPQYVFPMVDWGEGVQLETSSDLDRVALEPKSGN